MYCHGVWTNVLFTFQWNGDMLVISIWLVDSIIMSVCFSIVTLKSHFIIFN